MMKMKKNNKGFTLVELIVVITVLAILAAIAIPVAANWTSKAKSTSDVASIALYQSAIERSVAGGNNYPSTSATAISAITSNTTVTSPIPAPQGGGYFVFNTTTNKVITASAIGTNLQISG